MESVLLRNNENNVHMSIEFVVTLVQIVAATVVLNQTKGEHSEAKWIIAYTCACIAHLPILFWRFRQTHSPLAVKRINAVMFRLQMMLELFFVGWFVVFFWVFVASSSSLDHTSQLYWLCVAFLVNGCMRYLFTIVITCAVMCFCVSAVFLSGVFKLFLRLEKLSNSL